MLSHDGAWRPYFAAGVALLAVSAAGWAAAIVRAEPLPVGLHAVLMTFAFFPMFFAGFIFGPAMKWLRVPPPSTRAVAPAVMLHVAGCTLVATGAWQAANEVAGAGLGLCALAQGAAMWRLARLIARSTAPDRLHAILFALAGCVGAAGMGAAALAVHAGRWDLALRMAHAAVWLFAGGTFVSAAHRMIPIIGSAPFQRLDSRWPRLVPSGLFANFALQAGSAWHPALGPASAALAASTGSVMLVFAVRWTQVHSLRPRLLKMMFAGLLWLAAALLLSAAQVWWPHPGSPALHAFTTGFLATTMLAMLSRVLAGRSGRAVVADALLWRLFWLLQAAAVLRVLAPFSHLGNTLLAPAAVMWAGVWCRWAVAYGPPLLQLRRRGAP